MPPREFDYLSAGFDQYLTRSIDGLIPFTLGNAEPRPNMQQIAFDRMQSTGSLGDKVMVGRFIRLDGTLGRIAIFDEQDNEIGRIGDLTS